MLRPEKTFKYRTITVRLPAELYLKLLKKANDENRSISNFIINLLLNHFRGDQDGQSI